MKTLICIFNLFISLCIFTSCFKDKDAPCGAQKYNYYYLDATAKSKVPYLKPAFDTISFASDKGDTLTFVRQPIDSTYYCKEYYAVTDCLPNYDCYENYGAKYTCIKGNGSFEFIHGKQLYLDIKSNNPNYNARDYSNIIELEFLDKLFLVGNNVIDNPSFNPNFIPEMIIAGITYKNVQKIFNKFDDTTSTAYYTSNNGIIKVEDKKQLTNWIQIK